MDTNRHLADYIDHQIKAGVKGFVVGEEHTSTSLPQLLNDYMSGFRQSGIKTLFVEHVPADRQQMLDNALAGDAAAQRELYTHMVGNWYTDEAATARYDMMFAAHAAGIRVVGIDTSAHSEHLMRKGHSSINDMRYTMGDAYMAREIAREYKDEPFMVLAGAGHVAIAAGEGFRDSLLGSIDTRLNAGGIRSVGILANNGFEHIPDFSFTAFDGADAVVSLSIPDERKAGTGFNNTYARLGSGLAYMRGNFTHLVQESGQNAKPGDLHNLQQHLDNASAAFNSCADAGRIMTSLGPAFALTKAMVPEANNDASYYLHEVVTGIEKLAGANVRNTDYQDFCATAQPPKWLRPVKTGMTPGMTNE